MKLATVWGLSEQLLRVAKQEVSWLIPLSLETQDLRVNSELVLIQEGKVLSATGGFSGLFRGFTLIFCRVFVLGFSPEKIDKNP